MKHKGYILVLKRGHPSADRDGYVPEHRLVMENKIGRYLNPKEVVHHKDGNRSNNKVGNLELMPSQSKHMSHHYPKGQPFSGKTYIRDKKGRITGAR